MPHPASPADLAGKRRRHDYDLPRERTIYVATRDGSSTTGPGAVERKHRLAEWHALHDADVARLQGQLAEHDGLLGCEGCIGALPDDDREAAGMQTTNHGLLPGPAQGHALRESRAALVSRRWLIKIGLVAVAAVLVYVLVAGLLP